MPDGTEPTQRLRNQSYALVYASVLPQLQRIARKHGYALAVHGSMATDFDLLACPWTDEATNAETLISAIQEYLRLVLSPFCGGPNPVVKPHGRVAWALIVDPDDPHYSGGPYLDISVMPRQQKRRQRKAKTEQN